jgi:hypothetical protein
MQEKATTNIMSTKNLMLLEPMTQNRKHEAMATAMRRRNR